MDNSLFQPIASLIEKSQNILVLGHNKPDADALGAGLSFYLVMKELGKQVTVVTNDPTKENMAFLPAINNLQFTLGGTKDFIITLDTSKKSISKIKYNAEEGCVNIIITPKDGLFAASDVTFRAGKNQYDLIVAFDTGNVEYFGPIYENNVQLFFETPIINIDHHASNTDYGQLNLVVPTAASTTEILYEYFVFLEKRHNKKLISPDVATLLLAGLITDTGSFQHANTSPRSLEVAAELLDLGGRQQEIVKNFFKTKKLSTLKLWGMILSRVQVDPIHRMVWSTISHEDLVESEAEPEETEGIIDDLLSNAPGAEIIFLIKQGKDYVSVSTRSTANGIDVSKLCAENGGGGHPRAAGFRIMGQRPFDQVVSEIVGKVREFQAKRLNIHPEDLQVSSESLKRESQARTIVQNQTTEQSPPTPKPEAPKTEVKSEPNPQLEKKVTYLDFPAKQEAQIPPTPFIKGEAQLPKPTPVETPVTQAPKPASVEAPMPKSDEPKPEPKPQPTAPEKPAQVPKPMPNLEQKIAQNVAKVAGQPAVPPQKHHRKRHHKKPGGNPAAGTPSAQPK